MRKTLNKLNISKVDELPEEEYTINNLVKYIRDLKLEFEKSSKVNSIGRNLKNIYYFIVIFENRLPRKIEYDVCVYNNGKSTIKIDDIYECISSFKSDGSIKRYGHSYVMRNFFLTEIEKKFNNSNKNREYWCQFILSKSTLNGREQFFFSVLDFDKRKLNSDNSFNGKRHPFLDSIRKEWIKETINPMKYKLYFNELFRRASINRDDLLYKFENDFNSLSALRYESANNQGSIVFLEKYNRDYYIEDIVFSEAIKIEKQSYKKIRKLLEITNEKNPY